MREEGVDDDLIHEDAIMSYYLDYYTAQCTKETLLNLYIIRVGIKELNELVEEALALVGAEKHLFQQQSKKVRLMSSVKLNKFLKGS
jgi:hypothetical protein